MAEKIDVSGVSIKNFPQNGEISPINAGIWHNYYLYTGKLAEQELNWSDDYKVWLDYMLGKAQKSEDDGVLPSGSMPYISKIYDTLNDAINYQDFAPTINQLKEIFEGLGNDTKFNKTALVSVASVSYYSSLFWSEINIVEPNGSLSKIKIPKWVKVVVKDIAGAISGGYAGMEIEAFVGGPTGAAIGLGVGAVAGGVAGSLSLIN
jgi:hypothetical protein